MDADGDFADLCQRLDRADLATDDRFSAAFNRDANKLTLTAIFDEIFAAKTLDEWKQVLATAKGAWGPIQTPEEIYEDPQTVANGFLRHVDYPGGGLKVPVPPILFDEEAGDPPQAPNFAAHTDEYLSELDLDGAEIKRLRATGVVA